MATKKDSSSLYVDVRDVKGEIVADATVTFKPEAPKAKAVPLRFQKRTGEYSADGLPAGAGELSVRHARLNGQARAIVLGAAPARELFILGERGSKTYFREKVRVPVDAEPGLIGVRLTRNARRGEGAISNVVAGIALEPMRGPELAERAGIHLFRGRPSDVARALERLSENPLVEHAGAVVSRRENGFSYLTRDVIVRFQGPRGEQVREIAKELGFIVTREVVYAPSTYVLRWQGPATLDILDGIERLAARKDVVWAEPSLVITPELDAVIPNDYLWPGLWDRQLIGVQDAWQHLQDAVIPAFGDPQIILAVWDSGVQSAGGVPTNDDFAGTVSNGANKVFAVFDFMNMVPNNDNPWDTHGSGVAGVAVARANNPSPTPGQGYGLAGGAPNVRIMTIAGDASVDIEVADQYIWMAGFDPQSPMAGFPAPLAEGADVITCSLTPGAGAPLSGIARATLDFVTTFGRGGKGTMCFFSTGNNNQNNVTARPYGAYEKCFGIAATSFANDGVTEIRGPYSGWGQIAFCAPSQDQFPAFHNPPTGFAPWGGQHQNGGNLPSFVTAQTTLTAASAAGAGLISVANVAGFAVNSVIHIGAIGAVGSEPAQVTAVNAMTNQLTVVGFNNGLFGGVLINAHAIGAVVATGPAHHRNNFGGTSSATPLCASVGALVLSANPDLTYIEAREIMRGTAIKFDLANANATGQWLDENGNPVNMSGLPAVKSGWYGYGRVDAGAAVQAALTFGLTRDLVIRDNLADTGTVASAGAFWDSPDIWCRRLDPAVDPAAQPANYATAGPHEDPVRAHDNWIYARVRNNGTVGSLDAWVRLSVTHWPGMEFTWPASFQPTNGPGDPIPSPMTPGTYFVGEVKITGLAPGADQIVNVVWPVGLIPPADVATGMGMVHWHPCLLAEITPHDGPAPTGNHVWDDNNLAQKNISIVDTDSGADSDFAFANVVGHQDNEAEFLILEVNRGRLPRSVRLYVNLLDPLLRRRLRKPEPEPPSPQTRELVAVGARLTEALSSLSPAPAAAPWDFGLHNGSEVLFLRPERRVRIPIYAGRGRITPLVIGGIVGKDAEPGTYEVVLIQRQPSGEISGSATLQLNIGRKKARPPGR